MNPRRHTVLPILACLLLAILATPPAGRAGLGDALKKKVGDKATKKAEEAVDKAVDKKPETAQDESKPAENGAGEPATGGETGKPAAGEKVSAVSTKFDYVPGDAVMLLDDFRLDELGEFPARWRLTEGTFEVAELEGERWLRCVSADGRVRMKLPAMEALPEFWTLEFDFLGVEPMGSALTVRALDKDESMVWEMAFPHGNNVLFRSGSIYSDTAVEGVAIPGRHHVMFMARGTAIKAYLDRQRMANVPEYVARGGPPVTLEFRLWASTKPMITNVRFAEGCRPAKDMLAEGKLVTYGIHFASGSDVVLPESAPVLRQISAYLVSNPALRLKVTGHTDNVGAAPSNLDLSKRRAAAVAKVLSEQFGIAADRFTTDGKGDTQTVASNAKPEGRAMNRRVEFAKI
ncbi:MAG: OmpA family protein [Candidatus Eiseniibacteriota bacterium]